MNILQSLNLTQNTNNSYSIIQLLSFILIFAFILILAYYFTKFLAGYKIKSMKKQNINVIETISIGNANIHIIKACGEFFLISSSKEGIRFLTKVDGENIVYNNSQSFTGNLNNYLEKYKNKGDKTN